LKTLILLTFLCFLIRRRGTAVPAFLWRYWRSAAAQGHGLFQPYAAGNNFMSGGVFLAAPLFAMPFPPIWAVLQIAAGFR